MGSPVVVIGAGIQNILPALVCEYTIKKHCPEAIVIHTWHTPFVEQRDDGWYHRPDWMRGDPTWVRLPRQPGTMFSFCRHMVPEIVEAYWTHRDGPVSPAIYVDSDKIVFASVQKLWKIPFNGAKVLSTPGQWSVLKVDCAAMLGAGWRMKKVLDTCDSDKRWYSKVQRGNHLPAGFKASTLPDEWNHLERKNDKTKLTHYTCMRTQPWVRPGHPYGGVWFDALADAIRDGAFKKGFVEAEVAKSEGETADNTWQAIRYPGPHVLHELERRGV